MLRLAVLLFSLHLYFTLLLLFNFMSKFLQSNKVVKIHVLTNDMTGVRASKKSGTMETVSNEKGRHSIAQTGLAILTIGARLSDINSTKYTDKSDQ
jgi:hypothetical protein